jgi:aspartate aminotransferase
MNFSNRVNSIQASKTVELDALVRTLKSQGEDIIGLNVGEPNFPTPNIIKEATIDAIKDNQTKYSFVSGITELREKISNELESHHIELTQENVLIANGSKQIIYSVFQTICNTGDEIIVLKPYWVSFPESIKLAGGTPIFIDTKSDFQIDIEKVKDAITSKTKAIIINSPNNPSGAVYNQQSLEQLASIIIENDLFLIADEAYDKLVFPPNQNFSVGLSSSKIFERSITIKTFSKTFCMTGFRVGYMIAPKKIINAVNNLQSHLTGNTCSFVQYGAMAAIDMDTSIINSMVESYEKRCEQAYDLFSNIFDIVRPQGAFYLFCNVEKHLNKRFPRCEELALYILQEAKVAVVPGIAFGMPGYIRISFATTKENIDLAYSRIKSIL